MPLLSIVVPTRDRAETALACVEHLLSMAGGDFEVIVTDCSAAPVLGTQLDKIDDPRLRYEPIPPCSMTDNFNNGYRHCKGDYVTLIGDDDALLPTALDAVRRLGPHDVNAIASPNRACYYWANFPDPSWAGKLTLSGLKAGPGGKFQPELDRRHDAHAAMMAYLLGGAAPPLPVVYHGIVARRHLDAIANRTGAVFQSQAPDTFVTAALCGFIGEYVVVDRPLSMFGKSGSSNSARLKVKDELQNHRKEFALNQRAFDPLVAPVESVETYVADSMLKGFEAIGDDALLDAFLRGWLARSYSDSIRRNPRKIREILAHLFGPARRRDARVARPEVVATIGAHIAQRVVARVTDRLRGPVAPNDELFELASFDAAIALVVNRIS